MTTNKVICTVILSMLTGGRGIFQLKGIEYPNKSNSEHLFVDFSGDWPKGVKNQPNTFYIDENSCNYYSPIRSE